MGFCCSKDDAFLDKHGHGKAPGELSEPPTSNSSQLPQTAEEGALQGHERKSMNQLEAESVAMNPSREKDECDPEEKKREVLFSQAHQSVSADGKTEERSDFEGPSDLAKRARDVEERSAWRKKAGKQEKIVDLKSSDNGCNMPDSQGRSSQMLPGSASSLESANSNDKGELSSMALGLSISNSIAKICDTSDVNMNVCAEVESKAKNKPAQISYDEPNLFGHLSDAPDLERYETQRSTSSVLAASGNSKEEVTIESTVIAKNMSQSAIEGIHSTPSLQTGVGETSEIFPADSDNQTPKYTVLPLSEEQLATRKRAHSRKRSSVDRTMHRKNASVASFISLQKGDRQKMKSMRRRCSVILPSMSPSEATEMVSDADFEISWAMFNYFSSLGDPTRSYLGVSHTQWRRFCKLSGVLSVLGTATTDLVFSSSVKITYENHNSSALHLADQTDRPRDVKPINGKRRGDKVQAKDNDFNDRVKLKDSPPISTASLDFLQFFSALHTCAQKLLANDSLFQICLSDEDISTRFLENYMYPLAAELIGSLASTSVMRRTSMRNIIALAPGAESKPTGATRIFRRNRKIFSRVYEFYQIDTDRVERRKLKKKNSMRSKHKLEFTYASLLAFAKDFEVVPLKLSNAQLQKLMQDVKTSTKQSALQESSDTDDELYESRSSRLETASSVRSFGSNLSTNSVKSRDYSILESQSPDAVTFEEFQMVLVGIAQAQRLMEADKLVQDHGLPHMLSMSVHIEEDLFSLLRHLEYSNGRESMAARAKREHRTSPVTSSDHFKFSDTRSLSDIS